MLPLSLLPVMFPNKKYQGLRVPLGKPSVIQGLATSIEASAKGATMVPLTTSLVPVWPIMSPELVVLGFGTVYVVGDMVVCLTLVSRLAFTSVWNLFLPPGGELNHSHTYQDTCETVQITTLLHITFPIAFLMVVQALLTDCQTQSTPWWIRAWPFTA